MAETDPVNPDSGFRDATSLTSWTRGFLYAFIAVSLLSIWSDAGDLLSGGAQDAASQNGSFSVVAVARAFFQIGIFLTTVILVLTWIHRANHNARQLGAADMRFTPGWAVGWYFVPIAWFWKPFQAMKEIWHASADSADWQGKPAPGLLRWWWILWIVPFWGSGIVEWIAGRSLDEAGAETVASATSLTTMALDVPLALVLIAIIGRVHGQQMARQP